MPVRNEARYLDESIASIAGQTFTDLEIVVYDDGSTDGTRTVAEAWGARDPRIRITGSVPLGLVASSNAAVAAARAPILARMDGDDRSDPRRIERQYEVLAARPEVVLVGALGDGIDRHGSRIRPRDRTRALRTSPFPPFPHGSAMFRREAFRAAGGYRAEAEGWEEIDLFLRMGQQGPVVVLLDPLYHYRYHAGGWSVAAADERRACLNAGRFRCLNAFAAGRDYSDLMGGEPGPQWHEALDDATASRLALQIWAGDRPSPVPSLRRFHAAHSPRYALRFAVYGWAGWVSPGLVRAGLRAWTRAKDAAAGMVLRDRRQVPWRCRPS